MDCYSTLFQFWILYELHIRYIRRKQFGVYKYKRSIEVVRGVRRCLITFDFQIWSALLTLSIGMVKRVSRFCLPGC